MKTVLPSKISTIEEAKTFLTALVNNNEIYHPEDDAHDVWFGQTGATSPTYKECDRLNKLMEDIYNLEGNDGKHDNSIAFCPCGFILNLTEKKITKEEYFEDKVEGYGYSCDDYTKGAWKKIFFFLLKEGFSYEGAKEVMLSKYPRWAADGSNKPENVLKTSTDFFNCYHQCKDSIIEMVKDELGHI